MNKLLLRNTTLLLLVAISSTLFAQVDTTIWWSTKKIEDNHFVLEVPQQWKAIGIPDASEFTLKFEYTGVGINGMYQSSPLTAHFTVKKSSEKELSKVIEFELNEFNNFYDKVQEPGYKYDSAAVAIKTGEQGFYLHTRYYRRSKASNYSRYYLIIKNKDSGDYYVLTAWHQYKDSTYDVERSSKLKEYALAVFNRFSFR